MDEKQLEYIKTIIRNSKSIVFFGGAGVSVPSGIPDFRSAKGIYSEKIKGTYSPEEMVSHDFFLRHPDLFYEFYFSKMVYPDAKPNAAHVKLAQLEKQGILKAVVTQNIDGLHQMAGSKNVIELHGSIYRNHCTRCHTFYSLESLDKTTIPKCTCGGIIKPDVVLYGEPLDSDVIRRAISYISAADTLIVGGTSLVVYPAAGLIQYFHGKQLIVINLEKTIYQYDSAYELIHIEEDIAEFFKNI